MSHETALDVAALADDKIDDLARSLSSFVPATDRAAQCRRVLLSTAMERAPDSRARLRWGFAVAAPLAAAASVALWVWLGAAGTSTAPREGGATRPRAAVVYRGAVTAAVGARVERLSGAPDEVVRVGEGVAAFAVDTLDTGERFRVVTDDAEVEVRGTRFEVVVEQGRLVAVVVSEGRVEVRVDGRFEASLTPGQRWARDAAPAGEQASPSPTLPNEVEPQPTGREHGVPRADERADERRDERRDAAAIEGARPLANPVALAAPGEAEFRRGWSSLRAGDPGAAAAAFAGACAAAGDDALAEDACFWVGVAWKRAGDPQRARDALASFLRDHARSARAGEAAALLGWLQLDAGDVDDARRLFERAKADRVRSVRDSAAAGLRAVEAARR